MMIRGLHGFRLASLTPVLFAFFAQKIYAYPENTRYGYASCTSCHVSPTGGGLLTSYGRDASEEFMGMWVKKGENQPADGLITAPESILVGGDLRVLALKKETEVFKDSAVVPMQLDLEIAKTFATNFTVDASLGGYDSQLGLQRHYLMGNFGENIYARIGKFFPAFGIYVADHKVATRTGLGFDQGHESYNLEIGYLQEHGELIVDAVLKSGLFELSDKEKGLTARAAAYLGQNSQVGVSMLSTKGSLWERQAIGLFAIIGITKSAYLLSEIDQEIRKSADTSDSTLVDNTRILALNKLGYEATRGLQIFFSHDMSVTTKGSYSPRKWQGGPGVDFFPRPHLQLTGQAQRVYDETWSTKSGSLLTLVGHYYL
jgi:hypothetical protein